MGTEYKRYNVAELLKLATASVPVHFVYKVRNLANKACVTGRAKAHKRRGALPYSVVGKQPQLGKHRSMDFRKTEITLAQKVYGPSEIPDELRMKVKPLAYYASIYADPPTVENWLAYERRGSKWPLFPELGIRNGDDFTDQQWRHAVEMLASHRASLKAVLARKKGKKPSGCPHGETAEQCGYFWCKRLHYCCISASNGGAHTIRCVQCMYKDLRQTVACFPNREVPAQVQFSASWPIPLNSKEEAQFRAKIAARREARTVSYRPPHMRVRMTYGMTPKGVGLGPWPNSSRRDVKPSDNPDFVFVNTPGGKTTCEPAAHHTKYCYFKRKRGFWNISIHHPHGDEDQVYGQKGS